MSDAWEEIQAIKSKRNSLREKLEKRRKERQDILSISSDQTANGLKSITNDCGNNSGTSSPVISFSADEDESQDTPKIDQEVEMHLLKTLCEVTLGLPKTSLEITTVISKIIGKQVSHKIVCNLLQKFATQLLISVEDGVKDARAFLEVISAEHNKLMAHLDSKHAFKPAIDERKFEKRFLDEDDGVVTPSKFLKMHDDKPKDSDDIFSLLSKPSTKEKENKKVGEEILDLLSKPTAKERSLAERFRSQGGAQVKEFCPYGTKSECAKVNVKEMCVKLHFKKIIQKHTDEQLGDCSFLNTCFHMDTCKYVHYEVDDPSKKKKNQTIAKIELSENAGKTLSRNLQDTTILYPPQWVQCDLRYLDMNVFGKFAVIMADPPWDIHMELPYGTMSDDEMRQLGIPQLQDDGLIFLWVTGRAMELGRDCLKLWGYERVDEIIWVKTNQLQRIIRTGRTGHWLNHGKEHCLVGMKGNPPNLNRGLDCDVIVAEVRATSHKPDEIYGMIERLSPGTRKIELFGRSHNIQPNWITLGNQVDGVSLVDPELIESFRKRYPDGNCMAPAVKPS